MKLLNPLPVVIQPLTPIRQGHSVRWHEIHHCHFNVTRVIGIIPCVGSPNMTNLKYENSNSQCQTHHLLFLSTGCTICDHELPIQPLKNAILFFSSPPASHPSLAKTLHKKPLLLLHRRSDIIHEVQHHLILLCPQLLNQLLLLVNSQTLSLTHRPPNMPPYHCINIVETLIHQISHDVIVRRQITHSPCHCPADIRITCLQ